VKRASKVPEENVGGGQGGDGQRRTRPDDVDAVALQVGVSREVVHPLPEAHPSHPLPGVHKARPRDSQVQALLAVVSEIAANRGVLLTRLRNACEREDRDEVLRVARLLVGLDGV